MVYALVSADFTTFNFADLADRAVTPPSAPHSPSRDHRDYMAINNDYYSIFIDLSPIFTSTLHYIQGKYLFQRMKNESGG